MEAALPIIRELTTLGESLMWIVGPGHVVSENTSRGIGEPQVRGDEITVEANNWRFHLEAALVGGIQFVETYGELSSHYIRFSDQQGETLLRAYMPKTELEELGGHSADEDSKFEEMRARYNGIEGIEYVRREVRSSFTG